MSVHINIRIPDELAAAIDALGKSRSQAIIEALGAYLKPPTVIVAPPMSPEVVAEIQKALDAQPQGKVKIMSGHQRGGKTDASKRTLGRTPENLSLADNRDSYARPAHAPGCKCLMCQGK
jgi:hypothetical protein